MNKASVTSEIISRHSRYMWLEFQNKKRGGGESKRIRWLNG